MVTEILITVGIVSFLIGSSIAVNVGIAARNRKVIKTFHCVSISVFGGIAMATLIVAGIMHSLR